MEQVKDILRNLVYLRILESPERARLRKMATSLEIPDTAFADDNVLCRVEEWGPGCKYAGTKDSFQKGDTVVVTKTMQMPKGRGIFVEEDEILAIVEHA